MSELTKLDVAVLTCFITTLFCGVIGVWRAILEAKASDRREYEQYERGLRHGREGEARDQRQREIDAERSRIDLEHAARNLEIVEEYSRRVRAYVDDENRTWN
jgi:hypothetical protein